METSRLVASGTGWGRGPVYYEIVRRQWVGPDAKKHGGRVRYYLVRRSTAQPGEELGTTMITAEEAREWAHGAVLGDPACVRAELAKRGPGVAEALARGR